MERAVFGASEFFSEEAFFTNFRGIENVKIGHQRKTNLDIVEIWFNPWKVTYTELLDLFFDLHDPTSTGNQQFKNHSMIYFSNKNQLTMAINKKSVLKPLFKGKMVTKITPVSEDILF